MKRKISNNPINASQPIIAVPAATNQGISANDAVKAQVGNPIIILQKEFKDFTGAHPASKLVAGLLILTIAAWITIGVVTTFNPELKSEMLYTALRMIASNKSDTPPADPFLCEGGEIIRIVDGQPDPVPVLKEIPQHFCIVKNEWKEFLDGTVTTLDPQTGDKVEMTGLRWIVDSIVYTHPYMVDEIETAVRNYDDTDHPEMGMIIIPGYYQIITPTPGGKTDNNQIDNPGDIIGWNSNSNASPATMAPTATPMPTVNVAHIATAIPITRMPAIATHQAATPEGGWNPTSVVIKTEYAPTLKVQILESFTDNYMDVIEGSSFWDLDQFSFWDQGVTQLEVRSGTEGIYLQSNPVGGDGPDAHKRWVRINQVYGWPGTTLSLSKGVIAHWDGSNIRKYPLYDYGDYIFNGYECGANGLWLSPCTATYPTGVPSPTPQPPPPTATPRASITLGEMTNLFIQNQWSIQKSCQTDGSYVLIRLGSCDFFNNPSYWVDFGPIWSHYQGGTISIGLCQQLEGYVEKMEYNTSGVCFAPFK